MRLSFSCQDVFIDRAQLAGGAGLGGGSSPSRLKANAASTARMIAITLTESKCSFKNATARITVTIGYKAVRGVTRDAFPCRSAANKAKVPMAISKPTAIPKIQSLGARFQGGDPTTQITIPSRTKPTVKKIVESSSEMYRVANFCVMQEKPKSSNVRRA